MLVLSLTIGVVPPAFAAPVILHRGDPAPEEGLFLPHDDALHASTILKGTPFEQREAAILEALVTAQQQQIRELELALRACKAAVEVQQQIDAAKDQILIHYRQMLTDYRELLVDARAQFGKDAETIKRLEARIESLEKRGFWTLVISALVGVAAALFGPAAAALFVK